MFNVIPNCYRVDKIIVDLRQFVNLNNSARFEDIKRVKGYWFDQEYTSHRISRGKLTAQIFSTGKDIYLQHGLCENGPRRLREVLGIPTEDVPDEFSVRDNFLPVEDRERCDVFKFMTTDFPSYLEDRLETDFADFTSNIGGAIRQELGERVVIMNEPNRQSCCLRLVEAAADVLVPKDFDFQDYRFQENIAAIGWIKEPEPNDPPNTIRGYTYRHNVEFVIYMKDWGHPQFSQVRAELKFGKDSLKKIIKGVSFSISRKGYDKKGRKRRPTLSKIFRDLLLQELEPFAKTLFSFKHNYTGQERNHCLLTAIQKLVRTPQGYAFDRDVYLKLHEGAIAGQLVLKRSEFNQRIQEAMVRRGLFKVIPLSGGLYRVDETTMLSVVQ